LQDNFFKDDAGRSSAPFAPTNKVNDGQDKECFDKCDDEF